MSGQNGETNGRLYKKESATITDAETVQSSIEWKRLLVGKVAKNGEIVGEIDIPFLIFNDHICDRTGEIPHLHIGSEQKVISISASRNQYLNQDLPHRPSTFPKNVVQSSEASLQIRGIPVERSMHFMR